MVCIHGFTDTWRTWELVLPALERHHEVLAPTLAGHAGGPSFDVGAGGEGIIDALEAAMDEAGFERAHLVGNSLGGFAAIRLAQRGRAETVVALAPAGGWAAEDESYRDTMAHFATAQELVRGAAPYADTIVSTPEGCRRATAFLDHKLRAHSGGAASPPDSRGGELRCGGAADRACPRARLELRRGTYPLPGADRLGHRGPASAVAPGCGEVSRARPQCRMDRARRDRSPAAARRPGRDRRSDPRPHGPLTSVRSALRSILPTGVSGTASTTRISRGYL